jgi:hypothetical protein
MAGEHLLIVDDEDNLRLDADGGDLVNVVGCSGTGWPDSATWAA